MPDYMNLYRPYSAYAPMQMPQPMPQPQQQQNAITWVQGEGGAKSWMVAPNTTVLLMDSEEQKFYVKSADASGMPSMRIYKYTECPQNALNAPNGALNDSKVDFPTREEFNDLRAKYEELSAKVNGKKATAKKEVDVLNE